MTLILLVSLVSVTHAASPYQSQIILIEQGHSAQAYAELRPKLLGSAGNPEFDTAFGLAALDNGAPAEAITAFERVLAQQPTNLPVRTELARAYAQLGDTAAATRELNFVQQQPETPATVRANISNYASVLDEQLAGGPRTYTGTINIGIGLDSNINNATTSSYLIVPALAALGPARIATGAQGESSAYTEVGATLTVRQPLTLSKAVFASVSANQKSPWESSDYVQTTLSAEAGIQLLSPDNGKLTLAASAQQFWFGGEDYSTTIGATANWQLSLTEATTLSTYATGSHIDYEQNTMSPANRAVLGAMFATHWSDITYSPYTFAGLYAGTEQTENQTADYFSHNLLGLQAGFEIHPMRHLSMFTDATYEIRHYNADFPMFLKSRLDRQFDISTGFAYALTSNILLRPTLSYRYASSNIAFYDYTRWLANLNLRYTF